MAQNYEVLELKVCNDRIGARWVLQVSFKRVTRMSQECYRSVSSVLLLQGVLRVFVFIAVISATRA